MDGRSAARSVGSGGGFYCEATNDEMFNLTNFQKRVGAWAAETFPNGTDEGTLEHLRREVEEMIAAAGTEAEGEEAGDVLILLCNYAERRGFDLGLSAGVKQAVNECRQWGKPDEAGVIEHVPKKNLVKGAREAAR